jgi:hypothetical protein
MQGKKTALLLNFIWPWQSGRLVSLSFFAYKKGGQQH